MIEIKTDPPPVVNLAERREKKKKERERLRPEINVKQSTLRTCFNCAFDVDEKTRIVDCRRCGRVWDPIEAFVAIARSWKHYETNRRACIDDMDRRKRELEDLERKVRNLKAQKRRLEGGG